MLWGLGALAAVWLIVGIMMLPTMGRMMGDGMMGGMMQGGAGQGMMCCGGAMMGIMALQVIAMLGLVGVFVYLIIDSLRGRRA